MFSNIFSTENEMHEAYPKLHATTLAFGPVFELNGKRFVQMYMGQHEYIIVNYDRPRERYFSVGDEVKPIGYACDLDGGTNKFEWPRDQYVRESTGQYWDREKKEWSNETI